VADGLKCRVLSTCSLFRFLDIQGLLTLSKCVLTVLLSRILTKCNLIYMPAIKNILRLNTLYSWHSFLLTLNKTQRTDTRPLAYYDVKFVHPEWQLVLLVQSLRREASERKCVFYILQYVFKFYVYVNCNYVNTLITADKDFYSVQWTDPAICPKFPQIH
jgi:hypothetical protein